MGHPSRAPCAPTPTGHPSQCTLCPHAYRPNPRSHAHGHLLSPRVHRCPPEQQCPEALFPWQQLGLGCGPPGTELQVATFPEKQSRNKSTTSPGASLCLKPLVAAASGPLGASPQTGTAPSHSLQTLSSRSCQRSHLPHQVLGAEAACSPQTRSFPEAGTTSLLGRRWNEVSCLENLTNGGKDGAQPRPACSRDPPQILPGQSACNPRKLPIHRLPSQFMWGPLQEPEGHHLLGWAGRGAPQLNTHSPSFCQGRDSWVSFAPFEARSCFVRTHCCRHIFRVPAQWSARWSRCRAPLCTNCCQAPKHLGGPRERAGATVATAAPAACLMPDTPLSPWAGDFPSWSLGFLMCKMGLQ